MNESDRARSYWVRARDEKIEPNSDNGPLGSLGRAAHQAEAYGAVLNRDTGRYEPLYRSPARKSSPLVTAALIVGTLLVTALVTLLVLTGGSDTSGTSSGSPSTFISSTVDEHPTTLTGLGQKITRINPNIGEAFGTGNTGSAMTAKVCQALPLLGVDTTRESVTTGFNSGSHYAFSPSDVRRYIDAIIAYCLDRA